MTFHVGWVEVRDPPLRILLVGLAPRATLLCAALLVVAQAGCTLLPQEGMSLNPARPAAATGVGVDSDGFVLGEAEGAALPPEQLLAEVAELLAEKRAASARRLVQRYPDVAWELLRGAPPAVADVKALHAVAVAHDAQCVRGADGAGWEAMLADRAERPESFRQYAERRAEFLAKLRQGPPGKAPDVKLAPPTIDQPSSLLAIDSLQLTGAALLRGNQPAEAAEAYRRAVEAAADRYPYYEAQLRLTLSEALRHSGRISDADVAWLGAVNAAGDLLAGQPGVFDPGFWQRAAYHRPVHQPWPAELTGRLAALSRQYGLLHDDPTPAPTAGAYQPADERFVWACIGHWRLERGEPEAALVALKRAYTLAASPRDRQQLELAQAKALLALDQSPAAAAILVALSEGPDQQIARQAMATLGTLRLEAGNTKHGFTFLQRALEEGDPVDWPGRAGSEADLGLAYLMMGNEQAGLRWLHGAQARFEARGAHDHLLQSLENELAYMEQTKKRSEARALRQRIEQLEADGQPPAASRFGISSLNWN